MNHCFPTIVVTAKPAPPDVRRCHLLARHDSDWRSAAHIGEASQRSHQHQELARSLTVKPPWSLGSTHQRSSWGTSYFELLRPVHSPAVSFTDGANNNKGATAAKWLTTAVRSSSIIQARTSALHSGDTTSCPPRAKLPFMRGLVVERAESTNYSF